MLRHEPPSPISIIAMLVHATDAGVTTAAPRRQGRGRPNISLDVHENAAGKWDGCTLDNCQLLSIWIVVSRLGLIRKMLPTGFPGSSHPMAGSICDGVEV